MRDIKMSCFDLGLEKVSSKDFYAHLLSAMAQPGPGDLGRVGHLGNSATPVSDVLFPQNVDFFLRIPKNGGLFL